MNNLPPPLFARVLAYLKLDEKLKLRCVCKEWMRRIDEDSKLKSLLICTHYQSKSKWYRKWIDTNEFADLRNVFLSANLRSLYIRSASRLLDNVLNLSFYYVDIAIMNRVLARFRGLERLCIWQLESKPGWNNDKLSIDQPNLKVITIEMIFRIGLITVNAPALKFVTLSASYDENKITFVHPQSVEHLELKEGHAKFEQCFEEFVNLKTLVLRETRRGEKPADDLLCKLTRLQELHFFDSRLFDPLMQQKRKFKLDHLKLYLCGLNLATLEQYRCNLNRFDFVFGCKLAPLDEKRLQLYVDNYDLMAEQLYHEKRIAYDSISALYPSLPTGFLERFTRLKAVTLNAVGDEDQFCEFLVQCRSIKSLQFKIGSVSEPLMKRIIAICPYLRELKIEDPELSLRTPEPYSFLDLLFGFKHLTQLELDQRVSLKFMKKVFRKFTDLDCFKFFYDGSESFDDYEISYYDERPTYLLGKSDSPYGGFKLNTIFEKFRSGKVEDLGVIFV